MEHSERVSQGAPADYAGLRDRIVADYDELSNRLQQVARFALDHPDDVALGTTAAISARADVQPSTLIRFAKAFGFDGFSEMQRLFRNNLTAGRTSYRDRIAVLEKQLGKEARNSGLVLLDTFVRANMAGLEHLRDAVSGDELNQAVDLLARAAAIHVVAQRRSYPLAAYMVYALRRLGVQTHLLDDTGGMLLEQANQIVANDALVAISYVPYTQRVIEAAELARGVGAPVVAVTDQPLSPLASRSNICFQVEDAAVHHFRSLNASMCLVQTIIVSLGLRIGALRNDSNWGDTGDTTP